MSTRPERFLGEAADWDVAEQALIDCVKNAGFECGIKKGEAAFYAPKVEFDFQDVLGRAWTLSTIQVDMAAPTRFELAYVGRDGQEHRPAMLHRAILGSLERFIAIYLEHTAGDFPLWLAPLKRPEPGQTGIHGLLDGEDLFIKPEGFDEIHDRQGIQHRLKDENKWKPLGIGSGQSDPSTP